VRSILPLLNLKTYHEGVVAGVVRGVICVNQVVCTFIVLPSSGGVVSAKFLMVSGESWLLGIPGALKILLCGGMLREM